MCAASSNVNENFRAIVERIGRAKSLLALTHARADGDGLGSIAAMARSARSAGKAARLLVPDALPKRYEFLFDASERPAEAKDFETLSDEADLILIADTRAFEQLDGLDDALRRRRDKIVVIDHHLSGDDVGAVQWVDTSAAAAGVMTHELIGALGWKLSREVAEPLFVAITSDTGWFRFANTDARTLRAAADLLEAGVRAGDLFARLFQADRPERLKLMERMLGSLILHHEGKVAMMTIRKRDFELTGATSQETENLINEAMRLESVEVAVLLVENADCVRVSLRGRGAVDVSAIAQKFGGGGHARAAGFRIMSGDIGAISTSLVDAIGTALEKI